MIGHLRNFGNTIYPTLPVSFGGDTKLKADGPLYLSIPGEVKDPTQVINVSPVVDSTTMK